MRSLHVKWPAFKRVSAFLIGIDRSPRWSAFSINRVSINRVSAFSMEELAFPGVFVGPGKLKQFRVLTVDGLRFQDPPRR